MIEIIEVECYFVVLNFNTTIVFYSKFFVCLHVDKTYNSSVVCETPRKFITAVINLRGISTNKTIIVFYSV
jgi:hypothetical protein